MTLRRFSGFMLTVALAQLSLSQAPAVCASHDAMPEYTPASHTAMSMPAEASGSCDGCEASSEQQLPCDHSGTSGACESMSSCATVAAETRSAPLSAATIAVRVAANTDAAPANPTTAPDTPPPRG